MEGEREMEREREKAYMNEWAMNIWEILANFSEIEIKITSEYLLVLS